ncbi:SCO2400 family protein [Streptomyces griseorubiginosus]|uniref:SCO2400 family protein n=1 Tax=Streptomyces griseorubiginosus TaxID=67304 RepID=UPI002E820F21|nr:hypothetical protein [Streptomyces griseorubiginosus]WUB42496.1 hypothetical protein OHN19_03785 [Streptomyces griseorubiginosus]WUB51014.1 hypothetical protein OG942_03780 [Streptomyces griseorubiginosus]
MVQSTQEDQMDYCSSCRRHLNGALACPGCGAYAPDIAPPAHVYATTGTAATAWDEAPTWHETGLHEEPAAETGLPSEDVADAPVVTEGRAARRRQRARWKKNQRKAVVATAVALVGGGLTVSAMHQGANTRTQAATSPDNRAMGGSELPTSDDVLPASTSAGTHRSTTDTPATTTGKHRRTTDSASTANGSSVHTDSVTAPTPTATTASQSQSRSGSTLSTSTSAGSGSTGTSAGTTVQTPSSTATDSSTTTTTGTSETATGSGTGTSSSTSSGNSQTSGSGSSTSSTDPSGLCVLNLLCIS